MTGESDNETNHDGSCPECGRSFHNINIGPNARCVFCAAE